MLYKLTNTINGKIYIGCHQTKNVDDGYMGSGRRLSYAKKKYGLSVFQRDVLGEYETPEQMYEAEAEIVNEDFLNRKGVYNLTTGGRGGWGCHNRNPKNRAARVKGAINANRSLKKRTNPEYIEKQREHAIRLHIEGILRSWPETIDWTGRKHKEETKRKIGIANSISQAGILNSQYGTCWIYNINEKRSIKVKKEDISIFLASGWNLGRKIKW